MSTFVSLVAKESRSGTLDPPAAMEEDDDISRSPFEVRMQLLYSALAQSC